MLGFQRSALLDAPRGALGLTAGQAEPSHSRRVLVMRVKVCGETRKQEGLKEPGLKLPEAFPTLQKIPITSSFTQALLQAHQLLTKQMSLLQNENTAATRQYCRICYVIGYAAYQANLS